MSFTSVTVTGKYLNQDGTPAAGQVQFCLNAPMQDTSAHQIVEPVPLTAQLDAGGAFSVTLRATDDATTSPSGVTYHVIETIVGAPQRQYDVAIPHTVGTVDLSTLAPALSSSAAFGYLTVAAALAMYGSTELGYAERTAPDTSTNTNYGAVGSNKISGLSVTVIGQGLPVCVEFYSPGVDHSVLGTQVFGVLLINGSTTGGQVGGELSESTANASSFTMRRRLVLAAGVSYTFEVGKFLGGAGTGTYAANGDFPMHLSVNR